MLGIDITHLQPGLHEFALTPTAEDLDLDPAAFSDVLVDVRVDLQRERALVLLAAGAVATLECDRTLVEFQQPVEGRYSVLFVAPEHMGRYGTEGGNGGDVRPLPEPGHPLDLTDAVRDTLLLALPVRRIAPGAEAEEIPLQFGAAPEEGGVDPRWAALRKLRDDS